MTQHFIFRKIYVYTRANTHETTFIEKRDNEFEREPEKKYLEEEKEPEIIILNQVTRPRKTNIAFKLTFSTNI